METGLKTLNTFRCGISHRFPASLGILMAKVQSSAGNASSEGGTVDYFCKNNASWRCTDNTI